MVNRDAKDPIAAAYEAMQADIDLAAQRLEPYHAQFKALSSDPEKLAELAHRVFSDERFRKFRYSPLELHRAFEVNGYPQVSVAPPLDLAELAEATTWHLTDINQRFDLAKQLLIMLPSYVDAGQYMEAYLVLNTAYRMVESPERINFFLYEMFRYGMKELKAQLDARRDAFLLGIGTDPKQVEKMSVDDAEAWAVKLMSDPDKKARLVAFYAANPELRQFDTAEALQLEHSTLLLIKSPDAGPLQLKPEEVKPWLTQELIAKLQPLGKKARESLKAGNTAECDAAMEQIADIMTETAMEMATKIFTPKRQDQLANELKDYRRQLVQLGRQDQIGFVQGALLSLARYDRPSLNPVLVSICYEGLRRAYAQIF